MYKNLDYGTREREQQDIEHARKKLELAVRGLIHTFCELPSMLNDVEFLCEVVDDVNDLCENYKYRVQEYNEKYTEEE